jgi:hypothetical protein
VARSTDKGEGLDLDIATFRLQIGYQNPIANFRAALKQIAGGDTIPDYRIELVETLDQHEESRRGRKANPMRVAITRRPAICDEGASSDSSQDGLGDSRTKPDREFPLESGADITEDETTVVD